MQEYWELYMKNLEGHPATIQFNAGISMEVEEIKDSYPTVAFVKAKLKEPTQNGLLSEKEEPEILFMEDKLEASMIKFRIGKYVGRVISDGYVTFLYYVQYTYNWPDFIAYALNEHESYEVTNGYSEDSEWNYYQKLLYPTEKEWQMIQNHKVCDSLRSQGDTLEKARAIEHKIYYQGQSKKDALLEALNGMGYKITGEIMNDEGFSSVTFYRQDRPFYHDIDTITLSLIDLAADHGAAYDGWETSIVIT